MLANRGGENMNNNRSYFYQEPEDDQADKDIQVNLNNPFALFAKDKFWFEKYIIKNIYKIRKELICSKKLS